MSRAWRRRVAAAASGYDIRVATCDPARQRVAAIDWVLPAPHAVAVPPAIADAIHVVSSESGAGQLLAAGARRARIRISNDRLTSGPCDVDPVRHEELRQAWARWYIKRLPLEELRAAIAGDEPVVLWGTGAFADLVWLWWALDALRRIGADGPRFLLARPRRDHPLETVGGSSPEKALVALEAAQPITDDVWREGVELWRKYASPSPLAFDEARRTGSVVFPELTSSTDLFGAWFPRFIDGRIRLSELDEVLLGALDPSWITASKLLGRLPAHQMEMVAWPFEPYFFLERLRGWAVRGVLEREEVADENPWTRDRFRANEKTRALVDEGLDWIDDAPSLHVGGCVVNNPASPWVRIEDGLGWRIARCP